MRNCSCPRLSANSLNRQELCEIGHNNRMRHVLTIYVPFIHLIYYTGIQANLSERMIAQPRGPQCLDDIDK